MEKTELNPENEPHQVMLIKIFDQNGLNICMTQNSISKQYLLVNTKGGLLWLSLYNKRACPTKNEPQQGISYLKREIEGCEIKIRAGRRVSRQAYLRLGKV